MGTCTLTWPVAIGLCCRRLEDKDGLGGLLPTLPKPPAAITESAAAVELRTVWAELERFTQDQWARAYAQVRQERAEEKLKETDADFKETQAKLELAMKLLTEEFGPGAEKMVAEAKRAEAAKVGKALAAAGGGASTSTSTSEGVGEGAEVQPPGTVALEPMSSPVTFQPAEAQQVEMAEWQKGNDWRKTTVGLLYVAVLLSTLAAGMSDKLAG